MKNLDCVYAVFLSWKTGKKKSNLHVDFLVRITCSFFCENDVGICMLFF